MEGSVERAADHGYRGRTSQCDNAPINVKPQGGGGGGGGQPTGN